MTRAQTGLPGTQRLGSKRYRAKLRRLIERDGDRCHVCGATIDLSLPRPSRGKVIGELATIDHIVPLRSGGTNALENLKLAHHSCNSRREREMRKEERRQTRP